MIIRTKDLICVTFYYEEKSSTGLSRLPSPGLLLENSYRTPAKD